MGMTQSSDETQANTGIQIKDKDWLMAGASIVGPLGAALLTCILTQSFFGGTTKWVLMAFTVLGVSIAIWLWVRGTLQHLRTRIQQAKEQVARRDTEVAGLRAALNDSERKCDDLERTKIRMICPPQYMQILRQIAETRGRGHLLLFNVELNTFDDEEAFSQLWAQLADITAIQSVRMALPPRKFARWERIVTGVRDDFFRADANGRKFVACEYSTGNPVVEDHIAFALYDSIEQPGPHDWGALFLINRPFIATRSDGVHKYLHILEYHGSHEVLTLCRNLWNDLYDADWSLSAAEIQTYHDCLATPPKLDALLEQHHCDQRRRAIMRRVVGTRRTVDDDGKDPLPGDLPSKAADAHGGHSFKLRYRHDASISGPVEFIDGYCAGLAQCKDGDRPCIIWASGFGEGQEPRLAKVLSRRLDSHGIDAIEVFFKRSGNIKDTTCTRMEEDIKSVVEYAAAIPGVDKNRIYMIGISLSAHLAARVAKRDRRIRSLVLVAPPFDIVEMLDNFRRHYLGKTRRIPKFADFLKARKSLKIPDWDGNADYCNYFGHVVSSCHLVDLAVRGRETYGSEAFMEALGSITSGGRRVALIYGKNDPIVCPEENIPNLKAQVEKGFIRKENLLTRSISAAHYYPPKGNVKEYPFEIPDPETLIRELGEAISYSMGKLAAPGEQSLRVVGA